MPSLRGGGVTAAGPMILFVVLGLGSVVLSGRGVIILGAVSVFMVGLLIVFHLQGWVQGISKPLPGLYYGIVYALLVSFVSLLGCLDTRSYERLLAHIAVQAGTLVEQNNELMEQRTMLHQQQVELEHHRTQLEKEVRSRTAELQAALDEVRAGAQILQAVQSPLVPIAAGVFVLPLVGTFSSSRAEQFVQLLLEGIEARRVHTVLLDVTGLPTIDREAAQTLIQASDAGRLLGARLVLVDMAPSVAQTIVGLGIDLRTLQIERDLQSAVEHVLS